MAKKFVLASIMTAQLAVIAAGLLGGSARAADECLAAPNVTAPRGSHWYYRVDRVNHRNCWYIGPEGQSKRPAARLSSPAKEEAPPPSAAEAKEPVAPAYAVPAAEPTERKAPSDVAATPQAFGQRWSDLPQSTGGNDATLDAPSPAETASAPEPKAVDAHPPQPIAPAAREDTPVVPGAGPAPSTLASLLMLLVVALVLGATAYLVRSIWRIMSERRAWTELERRRRRWDMDLPAMPVAPSIAPRPPADLAHIPLEPMGLDEEDEPLARLVRTIRRPAA